LVKLRQTWRRWVLVLALLVPAGAGFGAWFERRCERFQCGLELFNYNSCIASCGIDADCTAAWKSPEATEKMVLKHFGRPIPRCPAGGKVTIVYERADHPWLPCVVCSMKDSHGHEYPNPNP
jgi:hypothetical protein